MSGRLRLDRFADLVEAFLRDSVSDDKSSSPKNSSQCKTTKESKTNSPSVSSPPIHAGPLYYQAPQQEKTNAPTIKQQQEMESAVPLDEALASACFIDLSVPSFPRLKKQHSMPAKFPASAEAVDIPAVRLPMRQELNAIEAGFEERKLNNASRSSSIRERRPLVNRKAKPDLDRIHDDKSDDESPRLDYLTVPGQGDGFGGENRAIPLIPFEEVMLIEAIGTGRVSNIYRAAWQHDQCVQMVALKVAMINAVTGDTSHIDELRREADIAARLKHANVVELLGVAADPECFCIAYKYCEGGSLLSLLTDTTRYYEYLPIALDIANGMAYLHSRNVIHRDLKPSNILLTQDHRAKIADFGMSVNNNGQELTAETGTYRYMAPE
jgi:tRNA A-37 threonylcarbamoyl transferase component Bud32